LEKSIPPYLTVDQKDLNRWVLVFIFRRFSLSCAKITHAAKLHLTFLAAKKHNDALREAYYGNAVPLVNFIARCVERSLNLYLTTLGARETIPLSEAAKKTNFSQEYVSLPVRRGLLDAFKIGRNWHVTNKSIERYIQLHSKKIIPQPTKG
jgi:hypothetical protein